MKGARAKEKEAYPLNGQSSPCRRLLLIVRNGTEIVLHHEGKMLYATRTKKRKKIAPSFDLRTSRQGAHHIGETGVHNISRQKFRKLWLNFFFSSFSCCV